MYKCSLFDLLSFVLGFCFLSSILPFLNHCLQNCVFWGVALCFFLRRFPLGKWMFFFGFCFSFLLSFLFACCFTLLASLAFRSFGFHCCFLFWQVFVTLVASSFNWSSDCFHLLSFFVLLSFHYCWLFFSCCYFVQGVNYLLVVAVVVLHCFIDFLVWVLLVSLCFCMFCCF